MLALKKYPDARLENYSKLLILLGLVLALFVVYESFRMKSFPSDIKELTGSYISSEDMESNIDMVKVELNTPPPPKVAIPQNIIKVEDDIEVEEQIIESTEIDEKVAVEIEERIDVVEEEEEEVIIEDVPFVVIEEVPIFPGCKGNKKQLRECFSEKVSKFVSRKFDANLGQDLGLQKGSVQRIFVMFTIDRHGKVTGVKARAPHKRLQYEAISIIESLPQMTPGKQRGIPVGVKYSLPIVFKVE